SRRLRFIPRRGPCSGDRSSGSPPTRGDGNAFSRRGPHPGARPSESTQPLEEVAGTVLPCEQSLAPVAPHRLRRIRRCLSPGRRATQEWRPQRPVSAGKLPTAVALCRWIDRIRFNPSSIEPRLFAPTPWPTGGLVANRLSGRSGRISGSVRLKPSITTLSRLEGSEEGRGLMVPPISRWSVPG